MAEPASPLRQVSPLPPAGGAIALLVICGICYVPMLLALNGGPGGDPTTYGGEGRIAQAYAALYALLFGVPLWIGLGVLLLIPAIKGWMPRWAAATAAILYPLAAIAAFVSADFYYDNPGGWSILVPALLPPLIGLHVVWLRLPALHAILAPDMAHPLGLGMIAAAAIAVIPLAKVDELQAPARAERYARQQDVLAAQRETELAKLHQEAVDKFHSLNADSRLRDHLDYVTWTRLGTPEHDQALAGARLAKNRQDDAVKLLEAGSITWLEPMWQFDLEATPALCKAYGDALQRLVAGDEYDWNVSEHLEEQLPNMKFLVAGHCNLDAGLSGAEVRVQKVIVVNKGDARWKQVLASLGELRQTH